MDPVRPAPERSVVDLLRETCRELVDELDASTAVASRVIGDLLLELVVHTRAQRPLQLGHEYLISDFPLTVEVVEQLEPRRVSRFDPDADQREVALLEQFGFDSLLMLPLSTDGKAWALLEIYHEGGRAFTEEDEARARPLAERVSSDLARLTRR